MLPFLQVFQFLVVAFAGWVNQQQRAVIDYLQEENRFLREQLGPRRLRFTDTQRRRLAAKVRILGRQALRDLETLVSPDTLLHWHRQLIARNYDGSARRGPGRPRIMDEIRQLIVRMALENGGWGYTRIRGALDNLGHQVARGTIANVLKAHGLAPAPERAKRRTWREFHWDVLAATDPDDGFLRDMRFLIHDCDPLFRPAVRDKLPAAHAKPVRLLARSPNLNAYAERFIRTIKESCLERMVLIGEGSLRRAVREFVEHYHRERNHQGLGNRLIHPPPTALSPGGPVRCRQRLGGMLNFYYRTAA